MVLSDGEDIDVWRRFQPIKREHDKFFKRKIYVIDCVLLSIGERIKPGKSAHHAEIQHLNFITGLPQKSNAIIWEGTIDNIINDGHATLPFRTQCSVVPDENSFRGYIFVVYMMGPLVNTNMLFEELDNTVSALEKFHLNYKEINNWIHALQKSNDYEPIDLMYKEYDMEDDQESDYFEEQTERGSSDQNGLDQNPFYNDQLDLDQQPPEFWDNI